MMLRGKLLLAQLPLALGLLLVGALALRTTREQGANAQAILQDNLQSVVALQGVKSAIDEAEQAAALAGMGELEQARAISARARRTMETELARQEANITEPGEREATARLRTAWEALALQVDAVLGSTEAVRRRDLAANAMVVAGAEARAAADEVLALNQEAMVRKSRVAQAAASRFDTLLALATLLALLAGGVVSTLITARLLRPLAALSRAARRIGEGDLDARARIVGADEVAQLAMEFDEMADHMRKYRETTLGELLQAQGATQAAIDSLPDAVLAFDTEGKLLAANETAERDLQVSAADAPLARVDPAVREVVEKLRAQVLASGQAHHPRGFEEAVRVRLGEADRYLLPRATPVRGSRGRIAGATVVLQDVTRLRRFDELKSDMVATVAHEFRTPLTSLRMAIHLCLEGAAGPVTEKQLELLHAARVDCERLQGIVDDLLDLSKVQSGQVTLEKRKVAVQKLLDDAVEAAAPKAAERGVALTVEDLSGNLEVDVDPDRLELVFSNLLANAIRYSPQAGTVVLRALPADGALRFEVIDEGPGVPEAYRERIFEKYFRVPGAASGAAGLGLYIAREIVHAHQGDIGVRPGPGRGSVFWFTVPLRADG